MTFAEFKAGKSIITKAPSGDTVIFRFAAPWMNSEKSRFVSTNVATMQTVVTEMDDAEMIVAFDRTMALAA